jgi:hypothetical protein
MVNSVEFTVIKAGSRMRMLAQSQNIAPKLNAATFQGSKLPMLVNAAPSMVNAVPNHLSSVNVIMFLV